MWIACQWIRITLSINLGQCAHYDHLWNLQTVGLLIYIYWHWFCCLRSSILCADVTELSNYSTEELFDIYDNTIRRIVDKHIPAYSVSVRDRRLTPWFDVECCASRCRSRMYERRYRRTMSPSDCPAWIRQIREMHSFFETKENTYCTNRIKSNSDDLKKLWRSMFSVLRRDGATTVPPSLDDTAD